MHGLDVQKDASSLEVGMVPLIYQQSSIGIIVPPIIIPIKLGMVPPYPTVLNRDI